MLKPEITEKHSANAENNNFLKTKRILSTENELSGIPAGPDLADARPQAYPFVRPHFPYCYEGKIEKG